MPTTETLCSVILALVVITLLLVLYLAAKVYKESGFRSDRQGGAKSQLWNSLNSGASMRMQGTQFSGGYADQLITGRKQSFLGGPEPPVFYDIGSVSDARSAIGGNMGRADEGADDEIVLGAKRDFKNRDHFMSRDVITDRLMPY